MTNIDIIRAWKDEEYCEGLSAVELAQVPENPAGLIELTDMELRGAGGGNEESIISITLPICNSFYTPMSCITVCMTFTFTFELEAI